MVASAAFQRVYQTDEESNLVATNCYRILHTILLRQLKVSNEFQMRAEFGT